MAYVLYNKTTFKIANASIRPGTHKLARYESMITLKRMFSKLVNFGSIKAEDYAMEDELTYQKKIPYTTVKNLLSGNDVRILVTDVGSCVDPSTERYHCM